MVSLYEKLSKIRINMVNSFIKLLKVFLNEMSIVLNVLLVGIMKDILVMFRIILVENIILEISLGFGIKFVV